MKASVNLWAQKRSNVESETVLCCQLCSMKCVRQTSGSTCSLISHFASEARRGANILKLVRLIFKTKTETVQVVFFLPDRRSRCYPRRRRQNRLRRRNRSTSRLKERGETSAVKGV